MATQHLYLVAQGSYTATALAEENWQVGVRLRVSNDGGSDFGNLPTDVDYADEAVSRDETNWTIESNFSIDLPAGSAASPSDYLNDQAAPAFTTFLSAANMFPNKTQIDRLLLYGMSDGRVFDVGSGPAKAVLSYKAGHKPTGASSSTSLPPQCSPVASWMTAVAGRKGKGRIYMPAPPQTLVSVDGGLLSSGACTNLATAAAGLVGDLVTGGGGLFPYIVAPIVTGVPWTKYARIKSVRVGNVIDTQRRRRAQITETYQTVAV